MGLKPDKITKAGISRTFQNIRTINQSGVAVLLVEQNAAMALAISHRGYVLETGEVILSGASNDLAGKDLVRQAYLGSSQAAEKPHRLCCARSTRLNVAHTYAEARRLFARSPVNFLSNLPLISRVPFDHP